MKKKLFLCFLTFIMLSSLTGGAALANSDFSVEDEPNDTQATADTAQFWVNEEDDWFRGYIIGSFNEDTDDTDWFRVEMNFNGDKTFGIGNIKMKLNEFSYSLTVYDRNMNLRGSMTYREGGSIQEMKDIIFREGEDYFFKVEYVSGTPEEPYLIGIEMDSIF
ncbi:hypothetical protein WAK64_07675 [Bacillus spongiae]|uniref:Uncharacterized protein n=1 Tax=Bacillus spongiae TaxID=2683610 RepID=A0ABU8HC77_9BACI